MKTPFIKAAEDYAKSLPKESSDRCILEYLLKYGVGREHARPWDFIEFHLAGFNHTVSKQRFQQGLLKKSRESNFYIASNDSPACRGYFLIQDKEDAEVMMSWYRRRIKVELARLRHLENLVSKQL